MGQAPNTLTAVEAARRIEAGTLTVEELAEACLARIAEREPEVGAFAHIDPDAVRVAARASRADGPLRGLPVAVKDLIDTADLPAEYGSPIWAGNRPTEDAAVVTRTKAAGGLILGKTVTTEFAWRTPGKTRNPHNLAHTPGGSSSGSAAAVADCMAPLAFGTQTAGSVIRPAAYCGVVGFKPTFGTHDRRGVKLLAEYLDTVGCFARSVEDIAFFDYALRGETGMQRNPVAAGHEQPCPPQLDRPTRRHAQASTSSGSPPRPPGPRWWRWSTGPPTRRWTRSMPR